MKKTISLIFVIFLTIIFTNNVSAEGICELDVNLANQDPYPALPGDYVEVLFQVSTVTEDCKDGAIIDLILDYPFSLDDGASTRVIEFDTYVREDYDSSWNSIYKIRVDKDALDGDYPVELRYREGNSLSKDDYFYEIFNITVEDVTTDFEVHIDNYKIADKTFVLEVLNTGDQDIKALTVEIPKQKNIIVKASNKNIVGDLDANEYTTADFEAVPLEGEIKVNLYYTDSINERRMIEKTVFYDPSYFVDSKDNIKPNKTGTYVTVFIILLLIVLFFIRRHKHKKRLKAKKEFNL